MKKLYHLLAEALETDRIDSSDVLADYPEWDSLALLTVVASIEEQYGVTVDSEEFEEISTAGDLAALVQAKTMMHV